MKTIFMVLMLVTLSQTLPVQDYNLVALAPVGEGQVLDMILQATIKAPDQVAWNYGSSNILRARQPRLKPLRLLRKY